MMLHESHAARIFSMCGDKEVCRTLQTFSRSFPASERADSYIGRGTTIEQEDWSLRPPRDLFFFFECATSFQFGHVAASRSGHGINDAQISQWPQTRAQNFEHTTLFRDKRGSDVKLTGN